MDKIRVKEESLNNWRSDVNVDEGWKLAAGAAALAVPPVAITTSISEIEIHSLTFLIISLLLSFTKPRV